MRHFLSTSDFELSELESIIQTAFALKRNEIESDCLKKKTLALVFLNPSLRTRVSMELAVRHLGGATVVLAPGTTSWSLEYQESAVMDADRTEHVKEFVKVLERYVDGIGVRCFAELKNWEEERTDPILSAFVKYAEKPIINLESAMYHPCQAMADVMTIRENFGKKRKTVLLTWAWHPKPLPMAVPNSFVLALSQFGYDLRIACPEGYELDDEVMRKAMSLSEAVGGSIEVLNSVEKAFEGVDVVYAKSWASKYFYGSLEAEVRERVKYRDVWIVDDAKMERTNDAIFMHCLPVRRNVVVTDSVIDSKASVVYQQAENRLHVQKAILMRIFGDGVSRAS
ncbi:MAG: N-acetylornithine carbamoyltransferase [Pyrinomonadaceae bacterium]|nr:N-acetylornithine carbamoyltransferase [Pyrinomonadaceae bacterium]MCX7640137.1 N-acetylornithine carbamoyltransferase [Pyrinomonadaceae bacterium]MDW8303275.1 N-acetylornithine carbamoyltransferase [Acidobacteriota bacterium]